jgi:2-dehydropantoate 2-reductase
MRFVIIGAGGIGAYYGARLLVTGHEVVFVARGEHLKALRNNGLSVSHPDFSFEGPVTAMDQRVLLAAESADAFDLIILTIKANATKAVMQALQPWLDSASTPVLSLQNGVDNEIIIASEIGSERTAGGLAVRIGGHIMHPEFRDVMAMQGKALPLHVEQEFADYLKCGRLERSWCMSSATGLPDIWNDREFLKEMKRTVT